MARKHKLSGMNISTKVVAHYERGGLVDRLLATLKTAGLESGPLSVAQLAPLDQFHSRGLAATVEMAKRLNPPPASKVIDIGSGVGGPSRYLAATYGCSVTGIDLSPAYVEAAIFLAHRTGLSDKVQYRVADALALPFDDGTFDIGWSQHVAMNIANRSKLYAEAHRVLRQGGTLAIYDVLAGDGTLHFPVPWAPSPESSFLLDPAEMRITLESQGFHIASWIDRTAAAIDWFAELQSKLSTAGVAPPPGSSLGLHVIMGPEFKVMAANLQRNLMEGRAVVVELLVTRV
jgi:ubiquinone/menaquinone biosynthesis C-methylase UbiE